MICRVTISGHSSGANSVMAHLNLASSAGLFSQALPVSSTMGDDPLDFQTFDHQKDLAAFLSQWIGCPGTFNITCLRGKEVSDILGGVFDAIGKGAYPPFSPPYDHWGELTVPNIRVFTPMWGGKFMPENPLTAVLRGKLSGSVRDDGNMFSFGVNYWAMPEEVYADQLLKYFPLESWQPGLPGLKPSRNLNASLLLNAYPYLPFGTVDPDSPCSVIYGEYSTPLCHLSEAVTDQWMYCANRAALKGIAFTNSQVSVYRYIFSQGISSFSQADLSVIDPIAQVAGCSLGFICHGSDLTFAFDAFRRYNLTAYLNDADKSNIAVYMGGFVNFVFSGNPNVGPMAADLSGFEWKPVTKANPEVLNEIRYPPRIRTDYRNDKCAIWDTKVGYNSKA